MIFTMMPKRCHKFSGDNSNFMVMIMMMATKKTMLMMFTGVASTEDCEHQQGRRDVGVEK